MIRYSRKLPEKEASLVKVRPCHVEYRVQVKFFRFWPKTMVYIIIVRRFDRPSGAEQAATGGADLQHARASGGAVCDPDPGRGRGLAGAGENPSPAVCLLPQQQQEPSGAAGHIPPIAQPPGKVAGNIKLDNNIIIIIDTDKHCFSM